MKFIEPQISCKFPKNGPLPGQPDFFIWRILMATNKIKQTILKALREYTCQFTQIKTGSDPGLLDVLTTPGKNSNVQGIIELVLLAEFISKKLENDTEIPPDPEKKTSSLNFCCSLQGSDSIRC